MSLSFEIMIYQPGDLRKSQEIIVARELGDLEILEDALIDLDISAGVPDDQRPLLFAIRNTGDALPTSLSSCSFAFTFSVAGDDSVQSEQAGEIRPVPRSETKIMSFDPVATMPAGNKDWHAFLASIEGTKEISRVQVWWGAVSLPEE